MKKIAFMFAAAAMFAACTSTPEKPATEEVAADSTACEKECVIDSAAVYALIGDTTGMDADTLAAKFEAAVAQMKADCCKKDSCNKEAEAATEE